MEFKFIIKKWANFYFFISNLSEWHFSCRHSYNEFWEKELGKLSKNEKESLKIFARFHKKYPLGVDFFGQIFFIKNNPFIALKKELPIKHFQLLKKVFRVFNPRFEKIYKKDLPLLKTWKVKLEKIANRLLIINSLNNKLTTLYNTEPLQKKIIKVYLLISSPNLSGGGANMDNESITLELSGYPLKVINQIIGVIWHELIHLHFENNYFIPLINKIYNNDQEKINLIKEATASSLLPNGVLGITLLNTKSKILNNKIPQKYNKSLLKLSGLYLKNNKFFDNRYIQKINSILTQ